MAGRCGQGPLEKLLSVSGLFFLTVVALPWANFIIVTVASGGCEG